MMSNVMDNYTKACNYVSRYIFDNGFPLNSKVVNEAVYGTLKERFELGSQMAQSVMRDVIARYRTVNYPPCSERSLSTPPPKRWGLLVSLLHKRP